MTEREQFLRRQRILGDFGEFAIVSQDLDEVLTEACRLVADALGTQRAKILEIQGDTGELLVRAGVGWNADVVGHLRLSGDEASSETYAIALGEPVICQDIMQEERFSFPDFMKDEGIHALVNVPIFVTGRQPYGLLQVDATEARDFSTEDIEFLRTYAAILGPVIDRLHKADRLHTVEENERQRHVRLSSIFDSAPVGLSVIDKAGQFLRVNRELARILGRSHEELVRSSVAEVTHPLDLPRSVQALEQSLENNITTSLDKRYLRPNGDLVPANSSLSPMLLSDGSAAILAVTIDLTVRHESERAIREAEARHRRELERRVAEATAELKLSRDFLQGALDASTDMIQIFEAIRDERGEIVDFHWLLNNHTSESRYGEVRGESLLKRNPSVVPEGIFDAFKRVTETGTPEQAERHYVHEQFDGWFYQSVVKLGDGVATTTKDITDWKTAQAEMLRLQEEAAAARLQASEQRFRSFAENSPDALWIVDARERQLVYLSPAFERIWGESRDAVLSDLSRWAGAVHPDDRARVLTALPRTIAGESVQIVYRILRRDNGQVRWIEDTGFPIRDARGQISHVGGISQDVTEQRQMAERLRKNQRRLRSVIEGIPQFVWRSDKDGNWTWSSPQWSDYTGQSLRESRGRGWLEALHPDDRERAIHGWRDADGSVPLDMETRILHKKEQRYRWFQTRALPVKDDEGNVIEWLGTSTDIDDLRQLQEEQKLMVAELQHRTRNLIAVVRSIVGQTIQTSDSMAGFREAITDRLVALSRVQGLLSHAGEERITIGDIIQLELTAFGADLESKRIEVGGPVVAIRKSVVQTLALAIHELATNARKYGALASADGRLRVCWSTSGGENAERRLFLEWLETIDMTGEIADRPEAGGGYGRQLIEKALPYTLRAKTTYELRSDGVRCTIDLPLS